jgi:hypothetical protein
VELEDLAEMRTAMESLSDGVGILGYANEETSDFARSLASLQDSDRRKLQYRWANDPTHRLHLGSMPDIADVQDLVKTAGELNRGAGDSEDEWNTRVQFALVDLALRTSRQRKGLASAPCMIFSHSLTNVIG